MSTPTNGTPPRSALGVALDLLRRGFWPVPLHPPGATLPGGKVATGKEPIGRDWGATRPTEASLEATYRKHPAAGVGLRLGPEAGIIDLECDGSQGERSLARLCGGDVPETMGWTSARGRHRLFRWDDRLASLCDRVTLHLTELPDLELRLGIGGQAQSACPPTIGTDGNPRAWSGPEAPAPLPEAAVAYLERALGRRQEVAGAPAAPRDPLVIAVHDPAAAWFRRALEGECGKVAMARKGAPGRRETLREAANTLFGYVCHGHLSEAEIRAELTEAGRRCGLEEARIADAIEAGRAWGLDHPLPWPDKLAIPAATGNGKPVGGNVPAAVDDLDDAAPLPAPSWPAPPDEAAYHGPLGAIVRAIAPHTEADPLAILAHLALAFGNAVGRSPFVEVEATRHRANEFAVVVGQSSMARKGTAGDRARRAMESVDADWTRGRIMGGLSSGEGLIYAVRDPIIRRGTDKAGAPFEEVVDDGVSDKRLLIIESEFGGVLRALEREGNRLSALLRMAWDDGTLRTMTKSPMAATGAHVSIIGHITADELTALLGRVDAVNGFANRFLWFAVKRARSLPFGGGEPDLSGPLVRLAAARAAAGIGRVELSPEARRLWRDEYERLTAAPPGMLGEVTSRAAPHALRLALIYALADGGRAIDAKHLAAGLALWDASARSAAFIFGDRTGNADADRIIEALRAAAPRGLTRSEVRSGLFQRNVPAARINAALALLNRAGLIRQETDPTTGGRPALRFYAIDALNAISPPSGATVRPSALPCGVNGVNGVPREGGGRAEREVFDV